jgi:steroid delta-isomerase-like uncharacterized protein
MTSKQNAATVLGLLHATWNCGDIAAIEQAVASDHLEHEPDGDEVGREHLMQTILAYRAAFPDLQMSFDDQICANDQVVTRWTATGTHLGVLDGIPPTGRAAQVRGVFIHRLAHGRIAETWTSFDGLGLLQQLGVIPIAARGNHTSAVQSDGKDQAPTANRPPEHQPVRAHQ